MRGIGEEADGATDDKKCVSASCECRCTAVSFPQMDLGRSASWINGIPSINLHSHTHEYTHANTRKYVLYAT